MTNRNLIGPVTVYQSPSTQPAGDFINGKTYGAISPRVVQLKYQANLKDNGKLLLTFEQEITNEESRDGKHPVFPIYESRDNGVTWNHLSDVKESKHKNWGKMNGPHLYELPERIGGMPAGTILVAGVSDTNDFSDGSALELSKSNDAGKTWQFQSEIARGGGSIIGEDPIWEPFLMVHNHRLICYYSDERDNYVAKSQDLVHQATVNGIDWEPVVWDTRFSTPANNHTAEKVDRPGMPVVAQLLSGRWVMSYEANGGHSTRVKISTTDDPEEWDPKDRGFLMANHSGGPFIATLNDGRIVFNGTMYNGDGNVYIFDQDNQLTSGDGISIASAAYPTRSGTSYFRDLVPLANGLLLVANGGRPQPSTSNSIQVETIDVNDKAERGKIVIRYVDVNNQEIHPSYIYEGIVGTPFDVTEQAHATIPEYQFQEITNGQDKLQGNIGANSLVITVTYIHAG